MNGCYIGRGQLLLSVIGGSSGFFVISGESEVKIDFEEDNESISDARNGVVERVDWYVRNRRARVEAECYRVEPEAVSLLLKGLYSTIPGSAGSVDFAAVELDRLYALEPNLTPSAETVVDALAAVIPNTKYTIDPEYGTIVFTDITGYTLPITVSFFTEDTETISLHATTQLFVQARVHGVNKITGRKVMAEFYRLALDISEEMLLIQKGFSPLSIRLQATPDVSQPLDPQLGQYGRIILL